jgi:hypothetical protein
MTEEFNKWWDEDDLTTQGNPYTYGTPVYWAWEGWQAALAAPVHPAHISPKQLLALAQEANLGLDKVIEVFRMAAPVQEEDLYDLAVKADNWGQP